MLEGVKKLDDLVAYQEGTVVSREIVSKPSGTVTLFAFAAGTGLSEHKTPYDALVYVTDGQAQITVSGKDQNVRGGEVIILPADKPHALRAASRFKMILTMIRSSDL